MEETSPHDRDDLRAAPVNGQPAAEAPLSPEESEALIERERRSVHQQLEFPAGLAFAVWGVVWFVGFGLIYLASEGSPGPTIPLAVAWTVTGVLIAAGSAVSIVAGVRSASGIRGPSQRSGAMIGWSYTYGFIALGAIYGGLTQHGAPEDILALFWPAGVLLVLGVLTLGGGAYLRSRLQYGVGLALLVVAVASVVAGFPSNFLVVSLGGGGSFLAVGVLAFRRPDLFREGGR